MDMAPRPAIQLYSVRSMDRPLAAVIRAVSKWGYDGVEFGPRILDAPIDDVVEALTETGQVPVGVHANLDFIEMALDGDDDLIARCSAIGCQRVVIPHLQPEHFRTEANARALAERIKKVAGALKKHDLSLGLHTDRQYYQPMVPKFADELLSKTPYPTGLWNVSMSLLSLAGSPGWPSHYDSGLSEILSHTTDTELHLQIEVAELQAAGIDPSVAISESSDRVQTIHLRDVSATGPFGQYQNVSHGTGAVDLNSVVEAAERAGIEWVIYENELDKPPELKIRDGSMLLDRLLARTGQEQVNPNAEPGSTLAGRTE